MTENRFGANVERDLKIRDSNKCSLLWSYYPYRLAVVSTCVLITLLAGSTRFAPAQQQSNGVTSSVTRVAGSTTSATSSPTVTPDERYRIGPGDVLDIRVFNRPRSEEHTSELQSRL